MKYFWGYMKDNKGYYALFGTLNPETHVMLPIDKWLTQLRESFDDPNDAIIYGKKVIERYRIMQKIRRKGKVKK